jgi:hypothetical protein
VRVGLTTPPGFPCWLLAVQDWFPELSCDGQICGMPKAAANEIRADDFPNRPKVIRRNFLLPYSTIYLGCSALPVGTLPHHHRERDILLYGDIGEEGIQLG